MAAEFPEGLAQAVADATELGPDGAAIPLRRELRDWIGRMVCLDPEASFRSLVEGQKALAQLLQGAENYPASSSALQDFVERCESAPWYQPVPEAEGARDADAAVGSHAHASFGPPAVAAHGEGAATIFDGLKGPEPPRPPTADLAGGESSGSPAQLAAEAADDAGWAPTPEPMLRTLFEAPSPAPLEAEPRTPPGPPPPPPPSSPASVVESPPVPAAGVNRAEVEITRYEVSPPQPARPARPVEAEPPRQLEPARPVRSPRHHAPSTAATRRTVRRPSRFTPARIGLLAGAVVALVLLALAVPRFWGGSGPVEGTLIVESEPSGAEVTLDGRDAGTTPATMRVAPGAHKLEVGIGGSSRSVWVNVPDDGTLKQRVELPEAMELSALKITTNPPGGKVSVNGAPSGTAPLRVSGLQPGLYSLLVEGPFGPVESEVRVEPGERATVQVGTAGWIQVSAPFDLKVTERGSDYGNTGAGPVMVPVGRHRFEFVNSDLAVNLRHFVEVPPGKTVPVPLEIPTGMLNVNADQPAEVWLDGNLVGHTPLASLPVQLGAHDVALRHATLGEVSYGVVVTLTKPTTLMVTFKK
jgi:hypothetical protein